MNTCIVCSKEVHSDDGYATDGKIFVCRKCAEIQTLRTITVHIGNSGVDSNLKYVREAPIEMESSLVDQTAPPHVELDKSILDEAMTIMEEDFPLPNGCSESCPHWPYDTCGHYYGELHECMLEEEENSMPKAEIVLKAEYDREIDNDIENMSEGDFMSKYCDDGYALEKWVEAHPGNIEFINI